MEQTEVIQLGEPNGNPPATTKQKRKPVRRDPEKRRLQNIQAQKKYREKLKRRLDDLETLAAVVVQDKSTQNTPPATISEDSSPPAPVDPIQPPLVDESWDDFDPYPLLAQVPTVSKCAARIVPRPHDIDATVPAETEVSEPDLVALSTWDTTTVVDPTNLILPQKPPNSVNEWKRFRHYIDCGCDEHHVEVERRISSGRESLQFRDDERLPLVAASLARPAVPMVAASPSSSSSSVVSDPYLNHITLRKDCMIAAMWHNCLQIGISDLAFCGEDSQSPFYRAASSDIDSYPYGTMAVGKTAHKDHQYHHKTAAVASDSMVRTVQRIFKTLQPDLRPTREQVLVPHHPLFDIFPFPTFRRNVLRSETLIDEDTLFDDILHGLICWGNTGLGKRDRNSATGGYLSSSGTPWDSRSWEAKPWFLRKYWTLLGGEDGELVRQSAWWRMMRGERETALWP